MARHRKKHASNHERWLVSYADLLTLLFAFFVVMFAASHSDHAKAKEISEAVNNAFSGSSLSPRLAAILSGAPDKVSRATVKSNAVMNPLPKSPESHPAVPQTDLGSSLEALQSKLGTEIKDGVVRLHVEERGIVVGLNAQIAFPSGGDAIALSMYPTLAKVAEVLSGVPNAIRLEGHTDSKPIDNARFRSNWELSAARSIAMMRVLHDRYHVASDRMAIIGYAETNAIADNQTEAGRVRNRRVDIVIVSKFGMRAEPGKELSSVK